MTNLRQAYPARADFVIVLLLRLDARGLRRVSMSSGATHRIVFRVHFALPDRASLIRNGPRRSRRRTTSVSLGIVCTRGKWSRDSFDSSISGDWVAAIASIHGCYSMSTDSSRRIAQTSLIVASRRVSGERGGVEELTRVFNRPEKPGILLLYGSPGEEGARSNVRRAGSR